MTLTGKEADSKTSLRWVDKKLFGTNDKIYDFKMPLGDTSMLQDKGLRLFTHLLPESLILAERVR